MPFVKASLSKTIPWGILIYRYVSLLQVLLTHFFHVYSSQVQNNLCKIPNLITKQTTTYLVLPFSAYACEFLPLITFLKGDNKTFLVERTGISKPK